MGGLVDWWIGYWWIGYSMFSKKYSSCFSDYLQLWVSQVKITFSFYQLIFLVFFNSKPVNKVVEMG